MDAMEKQYRAQREKRAAILVAEGEKQSAILKAEGQAVAIEKVFKAIHEGKPDPELLAYQYVQALPQVAQSQGSTVWVIPSEVTTALRTLSSAFGDSHEDHGGALEPGRPAVWTPVPARGGRRARCRRITQGGLARRFVGQGGQDVADGRFPADRIWQREVRLDLVAVAAAVFVLDDVPSVDQVGDDAVRAAFGDSQAGGDVPQPGTRVLGDAEQDPG